MITESRNPGELGSRGYYQIPGDFLRPNVNTVAADYRASLIRTYGPEVAYLVEGEANLDFNQVQPIYEAKPEKRLRLHTEPGIIFANHPTALGLDVDMVERALQDGDRRVRKDFTVLVAEEQYQGLAASFGSKHFLPAASGEGKREESLQEALRRINEGGVLIIFPSYGSDLENKNVNLGHQAGKIKFQNGLTYLLERVSGDKMVYSFGINRGEALSAALAGGRVRVSEECSQARDFQEIFADAGLSKIAATAEQRHKKTDLLLKCYLTLHEQNMADYRPDYYQE